jgi:hypothetical protein
LGLQDIFAQIEQCTDCQNFGKYNQRLKYSPKACIHFNVVDYHNCGKVRNLFIAEAPPFAEPKYFYNPNSAVGSLRRGLFKELCIKDCSGKGLEQFSKENLLIDTIKCRLDKGKSGVPKKVLANCTSRFLGREIDGIKPKNIILLGDTAKRGLEQLKGYEVLSGYQVKRDCGKTLQANNYNIILYAYPSTRNIPITKNHPLKPLLK